MTSEKKERQKQKYTALDMTDLTAVIQKASEPDALTDAGGRVVIPAGRYFIKIPDSLLH